MANFKSDSAAIDELAQKVNELSTDLQGELKEKLLEAAGETAVAAWKKSIQRHGHVDTGQMLNSVTARPKGSVEEIYPKGKDSKKTRNVEKAYILHYGTTKKAGSHFVDEAEAEVEAKSPIRMQAVFDQYLREKGLI